MKIALLQIMPGKSEKQNLEIGALACRRAKKLGVMISGIKDGLGFKPEVMYLKESGNE